MTTATVAVSIVACVLLCSSPVTLVYGKLDCSTPDSSGNFVSDWSFDGGGVGQGHLNDGWQFNKRSSLWTLEPADDTVLRVSDDVTGQGHGQDQRSLALGPLPWNNHGAVFASQYIRPCNLDGSIQLTFNSQGHGSGRLYIILHIAYMDDSYLKVKVSPPNSDGFHSNCHVIPPYGRVRAAMVHVVLEGEARERVFIDDVIVRQVNTTNPVAASTSQCPIYAASFPEKRQIIENFLRADPGNSTSETSHVCLATQLTIDRLPYVAMTAERWKGPVSAAVLVYSTDDVTLLVTEYMTSISLRRHVNIHLVWADRFNNLDHKLYPVNVLRNTALNACPRDSAYVILLDADIRPSCNSSTAYAAAQQAHAHGHCADRKCAFLVPLFAKNSNVKDGYVPKSKDTLLQALSEKRLEPFNVISHHVVDYGKWLHLDTKQAYTVAYAEDMEPYFITYRDAPLMNSIFAGYGRDKCAYSRALHAAHFRFFVLPDIFGVNLPDSGQTILGRSGFTLSIFLNTVFQNSELQSGHLILPSERTDRLAAFADSCQAKDGYCHMPVASSAAEQQLHNDTAAAAASANVETEKRIDAKERAWHKEVATSAGGITCDKTLTTDEDASGMGQGSRFVAHVAEERLDMLIEHLMDMFNTRLLLAVPEPLDGIVSMMLTFAQPDAVVTIEPHQATEEQIVRGVAYSYKVKDNATAMLHKVRSIHLGRPTLYVVSSTHKDVASKYLDIVLSNITDSDVILVGSDVSISSLHSRLCKRRPHWHISFHGKFLILKSTQLIAHEYINHASQHHVPPDVARMTSLPACSDHHVTVDVILMTRNRPLQTHAFLTSLARYVSNFNTVWIIARMDDGVFEQAYDKVFQCFNKTMNIQLLKDTSGDFGRQLLTALKKSQARYVVFAVDEIIWLRPVDLRYCSCVLRHAGQQAFSFQLRLGYNQNSLPKDDRLIQHRFYVTDFDRDITAYYPRQLAYDFGYVINVDGLMASRDDVLYDVEHHVTNIRHPGQLELAWILHRLHVRSSQWQFMYGYSRLVNNMGMADGRVADSSKPAEGSFQLANRVLKERRVIDVDKYVRDHAHRVTLTHHTYTVEYTDFKCAV